MQLGFYYDQSRCIGCQTCSVACKDWKDIPAGSVALRKMITLEEGRFPKVSLRFLGLSCFHCAEPVCVAICPNGALSKREEDGIVLVKRELCITGCRQCWEACPYRAPQFADTDAPMQMCDFCLERWLENQKPICVLACPQRALDAGPLEELKARYGGDAQLEGLPDPAQTKPSILFKARLPLQL